MNRGKQLVTLNLKDAADRERFYQLVREADVLVEGFRPGVIDKLQIGYTKLSELNPRLVLCSTSRAMARLVLLPGGRDTT